MVEGVSIGFTKKLELRGVGYRATTQENTLDISSGYSHNIVFDITFDLTNGNIQINRIIFFSNNDKKINSQKIDQIVEDNIYNKYHYSNWILFKNFAKKIII